MSKLMTFVEQFVALVQGDDAKVLAVKVRRKASSAIATQLAVSRGRLIGAEEALETAQENLMKARLNNGLAITGDGESYVSNLISAQNSAEDAKEALESLQEKIAFLEEQLKIVDSGEDSKEK